jgi:DNA polymerase III delta subunit
MVVFFYGTNRTAVRDAGSRYCETIGTAVTSIDESTYSEGCITAHIGATSLFGGTEIFLIDTPSSDVLYQAEVLDTLPEMAASPNVFVVLEGHVLADIKKKYAKHAASMEEYSAEKGERFNVFQIAEALARKDKKHMWVLLQQARIFGIRDEETIGIMWWQLKALRLAKITTSAEEAGMKEYPYKKAKQAVKIFAGREIEALSQSLLELYHHGHQGKRDMDTALERWVLTL